MEPDKVDDQTSEHLLTQAVMIPLELELATCFVRPPSLVDSGSSSGQMKMLTDLQTVASLYSNRLPSDDPDQKVEGQNELEVNCKHNLTDDAVINKLSEPLKDGVEQPNSNSLADHDHDAKKQKVEADTGSVEELGLDLRTASKATLRVEQSQICSKDAVSLTGNCQDMTDQPDADALSSQSDKVAASTSRNLRSK